MIDHVLTARDLLIHMSTAEEIDAPVIVRCGLSGYKYHHVRAVGTIMTPDFHMRFPHPLPELVLGGFDDTDRGWRVRGAHLRALLDEIGQSYG